MASNSSSVPNNQQWRNDLILKPVDQMAAQELLKDFANGKYPDHVLASTVCCSKVNCDKAKIEQMPESFFGNEGASPSYLAAHANAPDDHDAPPPKKEARMSPPEPYMPAYCPCVVDRGHLVTYCCLRRDCDDASKIGNGAANDATANGSPNNNNNNGIRERPTAYSHFKY